MRGRRLVEKKTWGIVDDKFTDTVKATIAARREITEAIVASRQTKNAAKLLLRKSRRHYFGKKWRRQKKLRRDLQRKVA